MEWEILIEVGNGCAVRRLRVDGGWIYQTEMLSVERFGSNADKVTVSWSTPIFVAEKTS